MKESETSTIENAMNYIDYIEGEIWKVIPGYSQYLVSNYGRMFGFSFKAVKNVNENKGKKYLATRFYDNNGVLSNSIYIHRIVAEVFCLNPDPEHKTEVHHKDCNSLNNIADNLEWLTPREHREKHKQIKAKKKELTGNEA